MAAKREVIWSNLLATGLEHLRLSLDDDELRADGFIIGVDDDAAFRVSYQIRCDANRRVRAVVVESTNEEQRRISLTSDGLGNWFNEFGQAISELENCLDVDISTTPFTNTFPIRRRSLRPDESAEIKVVCPRQTGVNPHAGNEDLHARLH